MAAPGCAVRQHQMSIQRSCSSRDAIPMNVRQIESSSSLASCSKCSQQSASLTGDLWGRSCAIPAPLIFESNVQHSSDGAALGAVVSACLQVLLRGSLFLQSSQCGSKCPARSGHARHAQPEKRSCLLESAAL